MSDQAIARLWTVAGLFGLALLWLGALWAPTWASRLGFMFLILPVVLAGITLWSRPDRDRLTSLCAAALALLFLLSWLL